LGLAISKAIIEMHQARISASSEGPGKGDSAEKPLPASTRRAIGSS
jgi:signal transduction histidine kinase